MGRFWPSTLAYFSSSMKEIVARHVTSIRWGPFHPGSPKSWKGPLSTTPLIPTTFGERHIHSRGKGSCLGVPTHYSPSRMALVLTAAKVACVGGFFCLITGVCSLRGSYFDRVWTWQRVLYPSFDFLATPLSWMTLMRKTSSFSSLSVTA